MARPQRVQFNRTRADEREFHAVLKSRVDAYFVDNGLHKHATPLMFAKSAFWLGGSVAIWAVLVSGAVPMPATLLVWGLLGFFLACVGFNVGHDAIHGSYSARRWVNNVFSWSYDLIGANARNWANDHNVVHHTWTNVPSVDRDIAPDRGIRFSPDAEHRWYHSGQHLYAWALYSLLTLNWVVLGDWRAFDAPHPNTGKRPELRDNVRFLVGKASHFGFLLVVPALVLDQPLWQTVAGFVTLHAVGGLTLSVVFQLAHLVEGPTFPDGDETGTLPSRWAAHQLHTTANFGNGSPLITWIVGGLDYQIEHHLFPAICHVHYPALSPIVRQTAAEFGLPYHHHPSVRGAIASHFRHLRAMGQRQPLVRAHDATTSVSPSTTA